MTSRPNHSYLCVFGCTCFLNQELLKPEAQTCWSEDSVKLDDEEILQGTTATQWDTQHSDADVEVGCTDLYIVTPVYQGIH